MSDELKPQTSIKTPEFIDLLDAWHKAESGDHALKAADALIAHIDAWGARLAGEAAKDAERYRLLRDQSYIDDAFPPANGACWVVQYHHPKGTPPELRSAGFGARLDATIDGLLAAAPTPDKEAPCGS